MNTNAHRLRSRFRAFQLRRLNFRFLSACLLFLGAAFLLARVAVVATQTGPNYVVNSLADTDDGSCDALGQGIGNHDCTLREAINAANSYGDGGVITFDVSGTILLTSSLPDIIQAMSIDGSGQSVTISGNDSVAVISLNAPYLSHGPVNFNAVTIAHGRSGNVGGIHVYYTNTNISNCTFNDNTGSSGGAIRINIGSSVVIANSTFNNNSALYGGGVFIRGLPNGAPSAVYIYNSTFSGNNATYNPPGVLRPTDVYAIEARAELRNTVLVADPTVSLYTNAVGITYADQYDFCNLGCYVGASTASAAQIALDTLKYNGGPTKTIALLPGSVLINAGNVAVCTSSQVGNRDQRGDARVSGSDQACDVGAYESMTLGPLTPLAAWRMSQGLAADGSQDLANPSGDGIANLLKYAFNLAPNAGDVNRANALTLPANGTAGLPRVGYDGQGRLVLEFVRRKAASTAGIAYIVETGPDLVNWSALGLTNANVTSIDATWERVSVTDPAVSAKRFGRVRVRPLGYYFNDFNAALGPATLYGSAVWTNAAVQLTDTVGGVAGSVIFNGITPGPSASGFRAQFNLQFGPTTTGVPADGGSFAVGALPAGAWGETGPGGPHSIAVGFDTYENGGDGSIGIHLWVNGVHLTSNPINPFTNGVLVPVEVSYDAGSGVTVKFNGTTVFNNVPVSGFGLLPGDQFGFGARTGGASERAVVDDVQIAPR